MNKTGKYEKNWVKTVSVALWGMGFVNIISALLSYDSFRFKIIKNIFDYQIIQGSRFLVVITGLVAMIVAPRLYRQKRVAWVVAIILLAVSGFAHIIKGADIEEASMCILLLGVLMPLYKYCNVKSDPLRVQYSGRLMIFTLAFVLLYTFVGLNFFADKLGIHNDVSFWNMFLNTIMFDTSKLMPQSVSAKFFADSVLIVNAFALIIGLIGALSPVIVRTFPDFNINKYKAIAEKYAKQSIQMFTLEKNYLHFTIDENPNAYLSYQVKNGVAMVIGNPCCDGKMDALLTKWLSFVEEHDWIPAFYQAQDECFDILKNIGFYSVPIGVEAVIDLDGFSLEGKKMEELRYYRNKAERGGLVVRDFAPEYWEAVKNLDKLWIKNHGGKEINFAMGRLSFKYLSETKTSLLFDKDNNLLAYLNNIELLGSNSRAVDLMRKSPDKKVSGAMEILFLHEILEAKKDGKKYYDLGLSPLAEMDKSLADNKMAYHLLNLVYKKQSKYYDFKGLHYFKSKFRPLWNQSFLLYKSQSTLPKILWTLLALNKA